MVVPVPVVVVVCVCVMKGAGGVTDGGGLPSTHWLKFGFLPWGRSFWATNLGSRYDVVRMLEATRLDTTGSSVRHGDSTSDTSGYVAHVAA